MKGVDNKIGWAASVVSIIAIGISIFTVRNYSFDAVMFIMAMLSAVVVLLIGWNIWTVVGIDGKIERIKKEAKDDTDAMRDFLLHQNRLLHSHSSTHFLIAEEQYFDEFERTDRRDERLAERYYMLSVLHARASFIGGDHDDTIKSINRITGNIDLHLENLTEEGRISVRLKTRNDLIEFMQAVLSYNNEGIKLEENKVDEVIQSLKVALSKIR